MAYLQFEHCEDDEINIIPRDLGESENLNVKELFAQRTAEEEGSRMSSSALKFIEKNKARTDAAAVDRDKQRLKYFKDLGSFRRSLLDEIP